MAEEYVCTAGCTHAGAPRRVRAGDAAAHDDRHLSTRARVLARMLRDSAPEVRQEVARYLVATRDGAPAFAAREGAGR